MKCKTAYCENWTTNKYHKYCYKCRKEIALIQSQKEKEHLPKSPKPSRGKSQMEILTQNIMRDQGVNIIKAKNLALKTIEESKRLV